MDAYNAEREVRLPKNVKWAWATALEHAGADGRCGRAWQCACGACNTVRQHSKTLHFRKRGEMASVTGCAIDDALWDANQAAIAKAEGK